MTIEEKGLLDDLAAVDGELARLDARAEELRELRKKLQGELAKRHDLAGLRGRVLAKASLSTEQLHALHAEWRAAMLRVTAR